MPGPLKAIVVDTNDPQGMGQVKLKFPSLGNAMTGWAPVVQAFGGTAADKPRVGDLVLVVFEDHNLHAPIVTGRLPTARDRGQNPASPPTTPAPAPPSSRSGSR